MAPQIKKTDSLVHISVDELSYVEDRLLFAHLQELGCFDGSVDQVEISLRHISHINSLCVTEIIHIANRFREALGGGELQIALTDLQSPILRILQLMQVSPFLELRPLTRSP